MTDDINALIERRNQVDEQLNALTAFLRATPGEHCIHLDEPDHAPDRAPAPGADEIATDNDVADIAYRVLQAVGAKDMHYVELAEKVRAMGGRLPEHKASASSMLNSILNADPRFLRPFRRGYYSLRDHFPNVKKSVGERKGKKQA